MQITSQKPELTPTIPQVVGEIYDLGLKRCDRGLGLFPKEGGRDLLL